MNKTKAIEILKEKYNKVEKITVESANQLERILSPMKTSELSLLKQSGIKWVSYKAGFILNTRKKVGLDL